MYAEIMEDRINCWRDECCYPETNEVENPYSYKEIQENCEYFNEKWNDEDVESFDGGVR
jgi:hypothetical protein